jgi:hypothetical protein
MSTESASSLFAEPSKNALLRRFNLELNLLPKDSITPLGLLHNLEQIIELMIGNPVKFDQFASVNSEWIGRHFFSEIENYFGAPPAKREALIRSIFTSAYRFLCELEFTQPAEPSFEVRKVMNFVHDNLGSFEGTDRQQLVYAAYTMPAQVAKKLIGHPAVTEFRKFSQTVEESRKLREEWDSDLDKRQNLLKGLTENIKKVTSEYNFVGLVNGFQKLKSTKEGERNTSFWSLLAIGTLMLALPLIQVNFVIDRLAEIEKYKATLMYSLPTIIAVEIILLYFFRVVLSQFRSVKAQLLQIDLRISLCQFIESYAEYVTKLRETDSKALSKFEALIFSGLVTEEAGIPSTFDGVDQVATLIRSLRGDQKT